MADYKKMYYDLFNSVTDAINQLQKAQIKAEEEYINSSGDKSGKIIELKSYEATKKTNT